MADRPEPASEFWSTLEKRVRAEWLAITVLALAATVLLCLYSDSIGISRLDHTFYDSAMRAGPHVPPDDDIVIIAVDDTSIAQLGHWPWRRGVHAALLERLGEARRVGFDIVFSDPNPTFAHDDALLAEAVSRHGRVVLPTLITDGVNGQPQLQMPLPSLARAAAALGYINVYPDSDGTIRSLRLRQPVGDGEFAEHFIVAMRDAGSPRGRAASGGPLLIPYAGPAGHFTFYPYAAVLRGEVPPEKLRDRVVFVGAWASGLGDTFPTPMTGRGDSMSGVEILANGLQALRDDSWIRTVPAPLCAALSSLPVLLSCLAFRRCSPRHSLLAAVGILLAWCIMVIALLLAAGIWLPVTASLIGVAIAFPLWSWRSQEVALQHIDHELQHLQQATRIELTGLDRQAEAYADRSLPTRVRLLHQAIVRFRYALRKREETLRFLSHDMRAPQNAILAMVELQRREPDARDAADVLRHIERRALDTLALMDGFVQLERVEVAPLERRPIQLGDLVQETCDAFWVLARRRDINVVTGDLPEDAWIAGDRNLLSRVLGNLLDNALKYSPDHTEVRCSVNRSGPNWDISIQDQGRGIAPQQIGQLFDPFVRLAADSPGNPSGAGLGLAFVRTAVDRHGGTIRVHSRPGHGSTFVLSLPGLPDECGATEAD